jgi:site-specific DNA-methyltransferase (adenine-specific)
LSTELFVGDCLQVVGDQAAASCDLVYLDPPFFSQKRHRLVTRARDHEFSFDDLWSSAAKYSQFLHERIQQFYRVLRPHGSIFFHCDRTASHLARAVLDSVFGNAMFRAEIIWFYRRWSNAQRGLLPQHQTVLWYSKTNSYIFNPIYDRYSPSTNVDQLLQQRRRDRHGKSVYAKDHNGDIVPSKSKRGVPIGDVWDIPYLNPKASERVGYPTQKPILLLERIIGLSTRPGDTVLDPFCGSGTTLVAATLLGRKSIGVDVSAEAISLVRSRLACPAKTESRVMSMGRDAYEGIDDDALACVRGLKAVPVQRNKGIDAIVPCEVGRGNALLRVQREDETLEAAVLALRKAARGKNASRLIVIATRPLPDTSPAFEGCIIVPTPRARIEGLLRTDLAPSV